MPGNAPAPFRPSDIGNAERLVQWHGQALRYVSVWKSWMVYDGVRWARDENGHVERASKMTLRRMVAEAALLDDPDAKAKIFTHCLKSESDARIKGMVARAKAESGVSVKHTLFDAEPWLFNCANGTLDLRSQSFRPHSAEDYLTKCSPVKWDPAAKAPSWDRFLLEVFDGRLDLINYLQRAVGYSLTGDTREQCLHLLHGVGANGKSTFLELLATAFGDYAIQADFATFLEQRFDGAPRNDVARLAGARMVRSSEVGEGKRFNESLVKSLTGSETVAARFLYSEAFEFTPTFKLWFAANHKPVIRGQDHAIWRRVRLVPFTVQFDGEQRDETLKDRLMEELPGILRWCVEGCAMWLENGLQPPCDVLAATADYKVESDVIGGFIDEMCETGPGLEVSAGDLYHAFRKWAKDNGEYELSQTAFGKRISERGFGERKSSTKYRTGLRLAMLSKADSQEQPSWYQ